MSKAEVLELIESGEPAASVARTLGISRARVYQILSVAGVKPKRHLRLSSGDYRPPTPRIITGGAAIKISNTASGSVSEFLVAADLMARGWLVYLPAIKSRGHDLVAVFGDKIITIEVRSARKSSAAGGLSFATKPHDNSDHYALVITGEPVTYKPPID